MSRLLEVLYGTLLFVSTALVLGTGIRLVDWIAGDYSDEIWSAVVTLVVGAGAGAGALAALRRNGE
jgi:hypothetical protein